MKLPRYPLASSDKMMTFEFTSEGKNGLIHKIVKFQPTNLKGLYNLAFGDKMLGSMEIDDKVISNNGDSEKVLATVVQLCMHLLTSIPILGFMQQVVQKQEQDFTEWGFQDL